VIPRIKNDLGELLTATAKQQVSTVRIEKDERFATTIVAVSGGYPNDYQKGFAIKGLETSIKDTLLFHSGTKEADGNILTSGGRVLCATALAPQLEDAIHKSKQLIEAIEFEGKYYRRDIGFEFVSSNPNP
jgi:phosphoribosylamine--glycine ligase